MGFLVKHSLRNVMLTGIVKSDWMVLFFLWAISLPDWGGRARWAGGDGWTLMRHHKSLTGTSRIPELLYYLLLLTLHVSFFPSDFNGFSSVPLWKRLMWLAMARGLTWITNYSYTFEVIGLLYLPFRETLDLTELLLFSTNFSNY